MPSRNRKYHDIVAAKAAYRDGKNITQFLKQNAGVTENSPDIIEVAYDLQAGSYVAIVSKDRSSLDLHTAELAGIIDRHVASDDHVLDIGTGELTTLSLIVQKLAVVPKNILAFDVSWSRVYMGLPFAQEQMGRHFERLIPFVAEIGEIPLADKAVDVTISCHSLEPNGADLPQLLAELFRVTRKRLVLFEPCYEIASPEGRARMDRLGYIKGVDRVVEQLGGVLIERRIIRNIINPLNPTAGFVIEPPADSRATSTNKSDRPVFTVPGTNHPLSRVDDFFHSKQTGLCFPILKSIPILRSGSAILASAL